MIALIRRSPLLSRGSYARGGSRNHVNERSRGRKLQSVRAYGLTLPRPHNLLDLVEGSLVPYVDITPNRLGLIFLDEVHSSANVDRF